MNAIIASDDQTISTKLRHALVRLGYECLVGDVFALEDAARMLERTDRQPDLLLIVLPDEEQRCLEQLKRFGNSTTARIIAVGPANDPRLILAAVHAGADDYLTDDQDLQEQLSASLVRLTAARQTEPPNGQLTIVASVGGGCGASVTASNLAVLIAREREGCGLLDFDTRSADQASLFNLKPRHTLPELCRNIEGCDEKMLEQSLVEHDSGVLVLAGSQKISDNRHLSHDGLRKIARIARAAMTDVVIDAGSVSDGGDLELLPTADQILLVFRRDFPAMRRLRLIFEVWDNAGIGREAVRLVANSCGQEKQLSVGKIQSALQREIFFSLPDDRQGLNFSIDAGNPVVLESPKSPFARSMAELVDEAGLLRKTGEPVRASSQVAEQSLFSRMALLTRGVVAPLSARAAE